MDHSWTEKFKKSKSKSFPISQLGHSPWRGGRRRSRSHGSCASSRCTPPATWRKARHHRHHRLPAAPSRLHFAIRNRTIEAYKALVGARFSHFPLIAALARPPRLAPMVLDPFSATTETMISSERARNRSPAPPWPSREEEKEEMGLLFGGSLGFSFSRFCFFFSWLWLPPVSSPSASHETDSLFGFGSFFVVFKRTGSDKMPSV